MAAAAASHVGQGLLRGIPPPAFPALGAALLGPLAGLAGRLGFPSSAASLARPFSSTPGASSSTGPAGSGSGSGSGSSSATTSSSSGGSSIASSVLEAIPEGRGRTVAVGISGGVDSAVAALLLKERGYNVVGVFMRNWDEGEETGNRNCSVEKDLRDAAAVCAQLGVPLHEADFVSQYWTRVFEEFLAQCARGLTPNPDLACNRHIKFDALLEFADRLGADLVATGHYARVRHFAGNGGCGGSDGGVGDTVQLLRGADTLKDQTYFLASVQPQSLERVIFPVGGLTKAVVRQLAAERGLLPAERRSSAGICFIGRRNFADFLCQYLPPMPGTFVSVGTGAALGPCPNLLAVTHGQRPGIGGSADRTYVVGKDVVDRVVYVCQGRDHPALLTRSALLRTPHWLSPTAAAALEREGALRCQYKARYGMEPRGCTLVPAEPAEVAGSVAAAAAAAVAAGSGGASSSPTPARQAAQQQQQQQDSGVPFVPSAFTRLQPQDSGVKPGFLVAHFDEPAPALTPQQAFVSYGGEVCLGSALIAQPGRTVFEEEGGWGGRQDSLVGSA